MKRLGLLVISLMTTSLLASCGDTFTVTWKNWDGTVLETDTGVAKGTVPSYEHSEPSRDPDKEYTYDFSGWDGDISKGVEADTVFTAQYNHTPIDYTAKFIESGQPDIEISFNADNLEITTPKISKPPVDYYTYKWVSNEPSKSVGSEEKIIFTKDDLHNWTFDLTNVPIEYSITFKKDGQADIVKTVTAKDLSFTTPEFTPTTHYEGSWVCSPWVEAESSKELGSNVPYTLDKDAGELANHTFIYTETPIDYEIEFVGETNKQYINVNNLKVTSPSHTTTTHKDGCWKEETSGITIKANTEHTFYMSQLGEHTFTWDETEHQYVSTFNYLDGSKATNAISLSDLVLNAPKTKATPQDEEHRYVWQTSYGSNITIESEGSKLFAEDELKEYVFTETEVENEYTITYVLGDESAVDPGNPTKYKASQTIALSAPTLDGFTFKGWYLEANESNKFQYQDGWEPGEITGDLTLYADWHVSGKTLDSDYTWGQISDISNAGDASKYFDVGETKKVQLKHQDLNSDGVIDANEVYQTVRIIGYNHDNDASGNPIGVTFEFADLISDANGYSLAVQWHDTVEIEVANNHYQLASIRKALNGDEVIAVPFHWAEIKATSWSTTYTGSVLSMLPNDPERSDDLVDVLKNPIKYTSENNSVEWVDKEFDDKLFMLSPREMGLDSPFQESDVHTSPYAYYKGHTESTESIRIKKQIKGYEGAIDNFYVIPAGPGQAYDGNVNNYAGYNGCDVGQGAHYWLRSPVTDPYGRSKYPAWHATGSGIVDGARVYSNAYPIAPAFCI